MPPNDPEDIRLQGPSGWNVLPVGQGGIVGTCPGTTSTCITWNLEGAIEPRKQDAWKFQVEAAPTTTGLFEWQAYFLGSPSRSEILRVGVQ